MPSSAVRLQQETWRAELQQRFGHTCVLEWRAFPDAPHQYSPRLDLAVGPFSTVRGTQQIQAYRRLEATHRDFLQRIWCLHVENEVAADARDEMCPTTLDAALAANRNARCFLAIEIENQVSRKHLLGGMINAAALGHLGIYVGWSESMVQAMLRARRYLHFLQSVGKPTMPVRNLLVLSREQAVEAFVYTRSLRLTHAEPQLP